MHLVGSNGCETANNGLVSPIEELHYTFDFTDVWFPTRSQGESKRRLPIGRSNNGIGPNVESTKRLVSLLQQVLDTQRSLFRDSKLITGVTAGEHREYLPEFTVLIPTFARRYQIDVGYLTLVRLDGTPTLLLNGTTEELKIRTERFTQ